MHFTYESYLELIRTLLGNGYGMANYDNWQELDHPVILRHDIDESVSKAVKLAELEANTGVSSTFFVLLTADFYNTASKASLEGLHRIIDLGHKVGLHFDEMAYPGIAGNADAVKQQIIKEARALGELLDYGIRSVSYHRPSKQILDSYLEIPGIINSYGQAYFNDFKYLSDSRRRWREPVLDIIRNKTYPRLHILTHAFWYNETEESISSTIEKFVNSANVERWLSLNENLTDLESVMPKEKIVQAL